MTTASRLRSPSERRQGLRPAAWANAVCSGSTRTPARIPFHERRSARATTRSRLRQDGDGDGIVHRGSVNLPCALRAALEGDERSRIEREPESPRVMRLRPPLVASRATPLALMASICLCVRFSRPCPKPCRSRFARFPLRAMRIVSEIAAEMFPPETSCARFLSNARSCWSIEMLSLTVRPERFGMVVHTVAQFYAARRLGWARADVEPPVW